MLTLAENLSPAHGWGSFFARIRTPAGVRYHPYHRFPVLGLVPLKLAMLPFPDDAHARVRAARLVMLAFFAGAAALAWLGVRRLVDNDWIALGAVLLAFSSFHALYYADLVATDVGIDLFAVMLAFHGTAVFATDGRFGQLLAKTCVALLLGWHVLALVGPFALIGLLAALWRRDGAAGRRYFALGATTLCVAAAMLGVNLARERALIGADVSVAELPTFRSALRRSGVDPPAPIAWPQFAAQQLERLAVAAMPYPASRLAVDDLATRAGGRRVEAPLVVVGGLTLAVTLALVALFGGRHRLPLAALALAGVCWAVTMRHTTAHRWHDFEGLFHIGVPLALFALTLARLANTGPLRRSAAFPVALSGVGAAVLVAAAGLMAGALRDPAGVATQRARAADFDAIRPLTRDRTVLIRNGFWWDNPRYLLRGAVEVPMHAGHQGLAEFAVDGPLGPGPRTPTRTPRNRAYFLYDHAVWAAAISRYEALAEHGAPIGESPDYQVHYIRNQGFGDDVLYVRGDCPATLPIHQQRRFFLHVYPIDAAVLSEHRRAFGFDNLDFLADTFWRRGGRCFALSHLPDYAIASLRTGQSRRRQAPGEPAPRFDPIWEVRYSPAGQ